jgi:ankyrin repeat protein
MFKTRKPIVLSVCAAGTVLAVSALVASAQTAAPTQTPPIQTPPLKQAPAQQQPVDPASIVVKIDPTEVDFGEIPTGDVGARIVKLINTSDHPVTITTHRVTCGCTALDLAPNTVLGPKEVKDVRVQLNGGPAPGPLMGKKVTFVIEGQPEIELPLKASAVSFVMQDPSVISPETNADGKITLKSRDGTKFRILSMQPPLITEFSQEPAAEHTVNINWEKYREMGVSRKTVFYFDHPKCQSLMANIQFSQDELVKEQERLMAEKIKNGGQPVDPAAGANQPIINPAPLDPNALLAQQIQQGQNDEVLKKIGEGLDPNTRDQQGLSLLSVAAKFGNVDLMKALINAKASVDSTDNAGRTPLMHAATSKNSEAVMLLLDRGASVTTRDTIGGTALSWASGFGDAKSVKALLDAGAEVEIVGRITGWTPLIWASGFGDPASIPMLTALGANVEVADFLEGATPMIHAARTGKVDGLQNLIKAGAKIETPDLNGLTPLLAAAKNSGGDAAKVKFLLDSGANIHAKDNRGLNALALARKRTDPRGPDVVKLLEPLLGAETPSDAVAPAAASNTPAPATPPAGASGNANGGEHKPGSSN